VDCCSCGWNTIPHEDLNGRHVGVWTREVELWTTIRKWRKRTRRTMVKQRKNLRDRKSVQWRKKGGLCYHVLKQDKFRCWASKDFMFLKETNSLSRYHLIHCCRHLLIINNIVPPLCLLSNSFLVIIVLSSSALSSSSSVSYNIIFIARVINDIVIFLLDVFIRVSCAEK